MSKKIKIDAWVSTFYEKGGHCDFGCSNNDLDDVWDRVVAIAEGNKNVYAVKDWIWHDIATDDIKLAIIKADYVLRTNSRKFDIGDWVRTSPIINFSDNCICETSNSFYILVGNGTRKDSDESIFTLFS